MLKARKKPFTVQVQEAAGGENLTTVVNGHVETTNTANAGDFIVTGSQGEQYIIRAAKLHDRYTLSEDKTQATTKPIEIEFYYADTDMQFEASWGEDMFMKAGDAIVMEDGKIGYGINIDAFKSTYEVIS